MVVFVEGLGPRLRGDERWWGGDRRAHTLSFPRGLSRRIMIVSFGSAPHHKKGGGGRFANAGRVVRKRALVQRPPRCSCALVSAPDSWEGGASLRHMTVLLSGIRAGPRLPGSRRFVTSPTHPYSNAPSGVRRRLSPAGEITSLQADGCEPYRQDTAPRPTTKTPHERAPAGRDGTRISAGFGAGISIFLCATEIVEAPPAHRPSPRRRPRVARGLAGPIDSGAGPSRVSGVSRRDPREPPAVPAHRPFRLSARLPLDLRARGRGHRRHHRSAGCMGRRTHDYTAGVICAKVARYAERIHQPEPPAPSASPQRRKGQCGLARRRLGADWLGRCARPAIAEAFIKAEARHGAEAVWPYYYAGTMGLVQRDGIHRLRHAGRYSRPVRHDLHHSGLCRVYGAGVGRLAGPDPREMAKSDLVVIWGTNAVATQVNVMTHAVRARKERGRADRGHRRLPQRDDEAGRHRALPQAGHRRGARLRGDACPLPRRLCRPRLPREIHRRAGASSRRTSGRGRRNGRRRSPGSRRRRSRLSPGPSATTKRTYFRLGYGFTRSRNGAVSMHAASCIPAVTGAWQYEGGGAFHTNGGIFGLNKAMIEGHDLVDPKIRRLDQSRIGAVLCGEAEALFGGPPVTAMLIQNTNPVSVAPEQAKVKRGFARDDLFVAVHEQVMTETAAMADIVLPATMFLEHDDIYRGGGHQYIILGPKLIDAAGRMPDQPPGDRRPCGAARLRPSRLRDERARAHRLDAPEVRPRHARRARSGASGSTASRIFAPRITSTASRHPGRQVPLQAGLAEGQRSQQRADGAVGDDAVASRLLAGGRGGGRTSSVPPRHLAGALLPQLVLQRDAVVAEEGGRPAGGADPSRGRRGARHRRRRAGAARQRAAAW